LRITDKLHLVQWDTSVSTPQISTKEATVHIATSVTNESDSTREITVMATVHGPPGSAPDGSYTCAQESPTISVAAGKSADVSLDVKIPWQPRLWDVAHPDLHTVQVRVLSSGKTIDEEVITFGIREFHFDADKGFSLNGTPMKLKGVCVHHEAGCLGAAVPVKVWERRLRTLKELGVNAIRTSHNPPAPELLDLCDRLGLLVMDEAFDEFTPAKNKWVTGRNDGQPSRFGYAEDFAEWSVRDISDMVRRDRNHPSIIMWSIGNEIDYANDPFSHPVLGNQYRPENPPAENLPKLAKPLIAAVKSLDTTRPVTAALATVAMSDAVGLGELLDVVGYNYQEQRYSADHAKFPKRVIYGSENSLQFSAWTAVRDNDYIPGQFLWTGIDYLGEANRWPNRGSSAGMLDMCGFKKPLAWFRQSLWSEQPMVYLCATVGGGFGRGRGGGAFGAQESWNWPSNATVSVRCYTTCTSVRLSLNGRAVLSTPLPEREQGMWTWQIPFEPGELKVVGSTNGSVACEFVLRTAGPARRIELLPDAKELSADDHDVCHVEFRIVDADGVRVPDATNEVTFALDGPARLLGIENGDLNTPATGKGTSRAANRGRGLAYIQSRSEAGKITVTATSPGLDSASVTLSSK
jgi:beta-galactosidase